MELQVKCLGFNKKEKLFLLHKLNVNKFVFPAPLKSRIRSWFHKIMLISCQGCQSQFYVVNLHTKTNKNLQTSKKIILVNFNKVFFYVLSVGKQRCSKNSRYVKVSNNVV